MIEEILPSLFRVEIPLPNSPLKFREIADLADAYRGWIEEAIGAEGQLRDGKWSESIAVGSESLVMMTKEKLGIKAKAREVLGEDGSYALRESPAPYSTFLGHENVVLRPENAYFWDHNL
jgi:putative transposase